MAEMNCPRCREPISCEIDIDEEQPQPIDLGNGKEGEQSETMHVSTGRCEKCGIDITKCKRDITTIEEIRESDSSERVT